MSSAVEIREAGLEDYPAIVAMLAHNGMTTKGREEWEHLWVNNPVYQKLSGWAIGWVAENPEREIVGYIGNIPLSFEFKGREMIASCGHSLTMNTSHRGYAGFLLRRFLNYKTPELITATTANTYTFKTLDALRIPRVPAGDWGQAAFWITNHRGFLASVLSKRGWPKQLSYPGSAVLWLKDKFTKRDSWVGRNHLEVQTCSSFDERFDRFWDELKHTYPQRLLPTRSREVLQWHFKYPLEQGRAWIVTLGDDSRLRAYAIFRRRDVPEHQLQRVQLVDFQALNNDPQILVTMLAWGLTLCRKEGIHMLEAFGFRPEKQAIIDGLAPYRRQLPSWWYFYKPGNRSLGIELQDATVWDPSHFDGDTSL
jgi:hypothetical protein